VDDKLELVEKHIRHLIAHDSLAAFSWSDWLNVVGVRTVPTLKRAFEAKYPALFKAYYEYQDLSHVHYILDKHPEWKEKLPTRIYFP